MDFEIMFFDLDSTLYTESSGLWKAIGERIDLFMAQRMGWPPEEIPSIRHNLFMKHGTTLKGLQLHHGVDPVEYLDFVHDIPLGNFLSPDPVLGSILKMIPIKKWIFTNADQPHADRILNILGIQDFFDGIIDVWKMDPFVKPMEGAYQFALNYTGTADARKCIFLDDSPRNLEAAGALGFFTVLVGEDGIPHTADRSLKTIHQLPALFPEFCY
jgi:pyrimidine 5'-nucleotidase